MLRIIFLYAFLSVMSSCEEPSIYSTNNTMAVDSDDAKHEEAKKRRLKYIAYYKIILQNNK